jgi:hypothetical protein
MIGWPHHFGPIEQSHLYHKPGTKEEIEVAGSQNLHQGHTPKDLRSLYKALLLKDSTFQVSITPGAED